MFEANSFATSQLIRRRQAASCACSEATNESVCAFIGQSIGCATLHPLPGDNSCVEPPDPIPNSEVKRARADGSVHLACESRSLPGSLPRNPVALAAGFLFVRWFPVRSEEHTSELQSLMRLSYSVFCLKKKNNPPSPS